VHIYIILILDQTFAEDLSESVTFSELSTKYKPN
jgi:hypothetical protein